ncbi:MAG: caspase family protein [Deltaproteobacteria bacterium]|nr:caspase family protein [Deltaproteobacteria bacterium]
MRPRQTIRAILIAILLLPLLSAAGYSAGARHALVIGVSSHDFWPALPGPAREAETLGGLLIDSYGYDPDKVVILTDSSGTPPTGEAITGRLDDYSKSLGPEDSLLVFYSGRSATDNTGETYWIPKDGRSESRVGWLGFSDLVKKYINKASTTAKSVMVVCDTPVKSSLTVQKPNPLSSEDLRYPEKALELGRRKGCQIIHSGAPYRPGDESTDGMGLLAFRLIRALTENDMSTADMETLLFSPHLPASGIAGPPLLRGRIASSADDGGLFVMIRSGKAAPGIARAQAPEAVRIPEVEAAPKGVKIVSASVSPTKGPKDGLYTFTVQTAQPASRVVLHIGSEKAPFRGSGLRWTLEKRLSRAGTLNYSVTAADKSGAFGPPRDGYVTVGACLVKVTRTAASPGIGYSGSEFTISAQTDSPASAAFLWLDGEKVPMTGSGSSWRVSRAVSGVSFKSYRITALDRYGAECPPLSGKIMFIKPPGVPDVASLSLKPRSVAPGEAFTVEVRTSEPAARVTLRLGDKALSMEGGPVSWKTRSSWPEPGSLAVSAVAENQSGVRGAARNDSLTVARAAPSAPVTAPSRPSYTPDLSDRPASLEKASARPETVGVDQPVLFTARVSGAVSRVVVSIEGVDHVMRAESSSLWTLNKTFQAFGPKNYTVKAIGKDGHATNEVAGSIMVQAPLVRVVHSFLQPNSIRPGGELTVIATTDREAASVEITLGGVAQTMDAMDSSRKKWRYSTTAPDPIEKGYKIVLKARNEEGKVGKALTWTLNE